MKKDSSNDEESLIRRIEDENKKLLDGDSQNFRKIIDSKIFMQSNYKD